MAGVTIIEETISQFNGNTGEITQQQTRKVNKSKIEPTDEFIKVSKYLNTIFAYNNIPLNLVPISLIFAQEMEFKTNRIYLLKPLKEEIASMLDVSLDRVNKLIKNCERYNIIKRIDRGIYEVNSFLYSTGSSKETKELQAHFDFENDAYLTYAATTNLITGKTVRKAVMNKKEARKNKQIPGQLSMNDIMEG